MKTVFAVLLTILWSSNAYAETRFDLTNPKEVSLDECFKASKKGFFLMQETRNNSSGDTVSVSMWLYDNMIYILGNQAGDEIVLTCITNSEK